jgi:hypothetical protein
MRNPENSNVDYWVNLIKSRINNPFILLIGTHKLISNKIISKLCSEENEKLIVHKFEVDSSNKETIKDLEFFLRRIGRSIVMDEKFKKSFKNAFIDKGEYYEKISEYIKKQKKLKKEIILKKEFQLDSTMNSKKLENILNNLYETGEILYFKNLLPEVIFINPKILEIFFQTLIKTILKIENGILLNNSLDFFWKGFIFILF